MEQTIDPQPPTMPQQAKPFPSLLVLLSLLSLLLLSFTAFLAYQNIQLRKQITAVQTVLSQTPTSTIAPKSSSSEENDYSKDFSFTLSEEWHRETRLKNPIQFLNYKPLENQKNPNFDPSRDKGKLKIEVYVYENIENINQIIEKFSDSNIISKNEFILDGQPAYMLETESFGSRFSHALVINPVNKRGYAISFGLDFNNYKTLRDQILSTFKFTGQ